MSPLITGSLKPLITLSSLRSLLTFFPSCRLSSPRPFFIYSLRLSQSTFILNFSLFSFSLFVPLSLTPFVLPPLFFFLLNHRLIYCSYIFPPYLLSSFTHYLLTCFAFSLIPFLPPGFLPSFTICSAFTCFLHPSLSLCLQLPFVLLCLKHCCQLLTPPLSPL